MVFEYILRSETPPFEVYKLHQQVMNLVCGGGDGLNNASVRPLWRSISNGADGSVLLVRSSHRPLGSVPRVKEQAIEFTEGEIRKFNCRLNISSRVRVEHALKEKGSKKVEKSVAASDVEGWLRRLLMQNGMSLENAAIVSQNRIPMKQRHFINAADVVFHARIMDPALARTAYQRGIGRKKAFGFGLLMEADGAE